MVTAQVSDAVKRTAREERYAEAQEKLSLLEGAEKRVRADRELSRVRRENELASIGVARRIWEQQRKRNAPKP